MTTDQLSDTAPEQVAPPASEVSLALNLERALSSSAPVVRTQEGDVLLFRTMGDPFLVNAFLQRAKAQGKVLDCLALAHPDHPDSRIYAILRPHSLEAPAGGELQESSRQAVFTV